MLGNWERSHVQQLNRFKEEVDMKHMATCANQHSKRTNDTVLAATQLSLFTLAASDRRRHLLSTLYFCTAGFCLLFWPPGHAGPRLPALGQHTIQNDRQCADIISVKFRPVSSKSDCTRSSAHISYNRRTSPSSQLSRRVCAGESFVGDMLAPIPQNVYNRKRRDARSNAHDCDVLKTV